MKIIKIIDLLNKIANGEEVPKIIQHKGYIYEYKHRRDTENTFNYICNENGEYLSRRYYLDNILNDEVEIIEEEEKIPEKLEEYIHTDSLNYNQCNYMFKKLTNKYNELIDYLKSKGE